MLSGLLVVGLLAAPAWGKSSDRDALKRTLADVLKRSALTGGRVTVDVISLDDGSTVFAQNPDDLLNPASNVKLFTSATALAKLGPDFRFETDFLTDADLAQGKAKTLYVRGKGDPTLITERLYEIVGELYHAGLREVSGDLVLDDTYFDGDRVAPGYDQEQSDRAYMAPTGALSLNWNTVGIYLRPGDKIGQKAVVEVDPMSDFFTLDANVLTGNRRRRRFAVVSEPAGEKQKIIVRGFVPQGNDTWSVWKKIDNPPMYFGHTFKQMLADRGIKVKGKVRLGTVPPTAKSLYLAQSDTLDLVLKRLNKISLNFIAEQLLKTLGAEGRGAPGTFAKGVDVVEDFLDSQVGIPRGSYVMKNGSGLNDTNRFSSAQVTKILKYMYDRFPIAPEYLSSLGIAGKDGTLRYRFEGSDAVGRLRAKTGTLENVSALSGYVQSVGGEKFAFSMMVNDYAGRAGPVVQGLDALGAAIAASGSPQGPAKAVAQMMAKDAVVGSMDDLKARIKTYLALANQADKRNISFLRTSWRSERDPAVRAVVAEALYQSNPQDYLAQRTLLDSFAATDDVYGRLRRAAKDLGIEVPGVPSILDLAAEGNLDALARTVELCRAAQGDDAASQQIQDGFAEVARAAPDELLMALRTAQSADREAAVAVLAKGLVKAADADHPFWPALRKSMGAPDPEVASFAKQMESALSLKIAQEKEPKGAVPAAAATNAPLPAAMPAALPPTADTRPGG